MTESCQAWILDSLIWGHMSFVRVTESVSSSPRATRSAKSAMSTQMPVIRPAASGLAVGPPSRVMISATRAEGSSRSPTLAAVSVREVKVSRRPPQAVTTSPAATSANPARRMTISSVRVWSFLSVWDSRLGIGGWGLPQPPIPKPQPLTRLPLTAHRTDCHQRPDQGRDDRLSAQPGEPERKRHGAAHVRRQLHIIEGGGQSGHPGRRAGAERNPGFVAPDQYVLDSQRPAEHPEPGQIEQPVGLLREGSEPLPHFLPQLINFAG